MPGIDEDIVRELMHRCTDDLHAPTAVTSGIVRRHRRARLRNRALGAVVTGAAAGTALAVAASGPASAPRPGVGSPIGGNPAASRSATTPGLRLTAAQTALYRLSAAAAATAGRPAGRYVEMAERQDTYQRTTVIDSLTGDIWTYQHGGGVPGELPVDRHGSPTEAAFDAMPTDPSALRAVLLAQAKQQQAQADAEMRRQNAAHGDKKVIPALHLTDDDYVFEQATDMLWNPLVGPALRSALYKVLAATPGVQVSTGTTDGIGRPAVEISRYDSAEGVGDETFENPRTGALLETAFFYHASGTRGTDIYLSVTSSDTQPSDPYHD